MISSIHQKVLPVVIMMAISFGSHASSGKHLRPGEDRIYTSDTISTDGKVSASGSRLSELHKITQNTKFSAGEAGASQVRAESIRKAAFSWGVQEGLYFRFGEITEKLNEISFLLHTTFNFNKFVYDGKLLLPTVQKAERVFNQISDKSSRTYDVSISLDRPAKIISQVPTWRDYLIRSIDKPKKPHDALFPRSQEEARIWAEALDSGWNEGIKQANDIHDLDATLLEKEFAGLYRFRKLVAMGYFSLPKVSKSSYGHVKYDNGKTINLNDTVYTITVESDFKDIEDWEPFFRTPLHREELH